MLACESASRRPSTANTTTPRPKSRHGISTGQTAPGSNVMVCRLRSATAGKAMTAFKARCPCALTRPLRRNAMPAKRQAKINSRLVT